MDKKELLRTIPKIDEVLKDQRLFAFFEDTPRELIVESAREIMEDMRNAIINHDCPPPLHDGLIDLVVNKLKEKREKSLRRAINATGVVLHTNLGRAKLSEASCRSVSEAAGNYSTLEYNLKTGTRGSRHDHIEKLITRITGAEAAMVVNNNAAATMLCLSALAAGREVVVSRGELVEIGGSFRIPEIMEQSGAVLVEVGTTNKTRIDDYKKAVNKERTGALLKVHTSNYKILGFTAETALPELVSLGKEENIPVIYDLGSGLMTDLRAWGVDEPTVADSLRTGIDVILFSGDKLLGGPQGGIIAGKKELISKMKNHPLARVLRVDKLTLAAMEATFREYLDMEKALAAIPILAMITAPPEILKARAERLAGKLSGIGDIVKAEIIRAEEQVGGGAAPTAALEGYAVALAGGFITAEKLERELRSWRIPVIIRIFKDKVLIHTRTITDEEADEIALALIAIADKARAGQQMRGEKI